MPPWGSAVSRSTPGTPRAAPSRTGPDASPGSAHRFSRWLRVLRFLPPLRNPCLALPHLGSSPLCGLQRSCPSCNGLGFIHPRLQTLTVAYKPWEDFSRSRSSVLSILARCLFSYKASCFQMGNYCTGIYAVLPLSGCVGCHSSMN